MTRGDTVTVEAAVALGRSISPKRILPGTKTAAVAGIVVSCVINARLRGSKYTFAIDDRGWEPRSLLATETARWTWEVGPKIGGTQPLVLEMRPIVKVRSSDRSDEADAFENAEAASVETYEIKAEVHVPWTERPAEIMSRLAATFKVAQDLIGTIAAVLTGLLGIAATLGIKRAKASRAT